MNKFLVGRVVQLNSGGTDMTIVDIRSDGVISTAWIDANGVPQEMKAPSECFFSSQEWAHEQAN